MNHDVLSFRGAFKPAPNCAANDSELGPCERACGRAICLLRADCVRPVLEVRHNVLQRIARAWRIRSAHKHLAQLEEYYGHIEVGNSTPAHALAKWRKRVEVARVDLAIAQR